MAELGCVLRSGSPHCGAFDDHPRSHVFPECHQKLARNGDDQRLAQASTVAGDALMEPPAERGLRLVAQPQPRELEHGRSQPRVPRLADALFPVDCPTLPRCRRQSGIGCDLSPVMVVGQFE